MNFLSKAVVIVVVLLLIGCSTTSRFSMQNLNYLYSENLDKHLIAKALKKSDTLFTIYLDILKQGSEKAAFTSDKIPLSYSLYGSHSNSEFLKEDSLYLSAKDFPGQLLNFDISIPSPGTYHLRVTIDDEQQVKLTAVVFIKNTRFTQEDFLLLDSAGNPMLFPYPGKMSELKVQSYTMQTNKLWVYFYQRSYGPAAPPFVYVQEPAYRYEPDSIFTIAGKHANIINISKRGFYHIIADSNQREGITVFKYEDAFPEIKSARDMLLPLRYITSSEEYAKLSSADNKRIAVEEFWLRLKGNIERARYSIKRYYSRVEDANILFSSYLEGWKSDRGMIYIVYGPPTLVSRDDDSEIWFYGERNSPGVLRFEFVKIKNPFTDKDYQLVRSPNYKESWYINVDNWRR